MNHQIMYRCTGTCGGVSSVAKNCGAESCNCFNQPLQAVEQCDACAGFAEKDGKAHVCAKCIPA